MQQTLGNIHCKLHPRQWEVFSCPARFRVLVAGRRFGKTHLALVEMLHAAAQAADRVVWYVGPNDHQSKRIAWERLKKLTRPFWAKQPNESELRIEIANGSTLTICGAFHPDSLRGQGIDFLVLDEFSSMKPEAWTEVFRSALADRKGRALFIGTPKGRNHFYELYEHAQNNENWAAFQFTTAQGGLVDRTELEAAARDLDPETYRQELEAQFTAMVRNRVYYAFVREINVQNLSFNDRYPIVWSLDFNVNPMCMLLMQKVGEIVHVLEEIIVKPEANTELACQRFLDRIQTYYAQTHWSQRPLIIKIYGDASGNQRRTAGAQTDWTLIRQFFNMWVGTYKPEFYITSSNPTIRDRINCVNSRLRNYHEEARLLIDPKCRELIRDLEEVSWSLDSIGSPTSELNKTDRARTHTSDALGYFISQVFPLLGTIGERGDGRII